MSRDTQVQHIMCEMENTQPQTGESHALWSWLECVVLDVDREEISREQGGSPGPSQEGQQVLMGEEGV